MIDSINSQHSILWRCLLQKKNAKMGKSLFKEFRTKVNSKMHEFPHRKVIFFNIKIQSTYIGPRNRSIYLK